MYIFFFFSSSVHSLASMQPGKAIFSLCFSVLPPWLYTAPLAVLCSALWGTVLCTALHCTALHCPSGSGSHSLWSNRPLAQMASGPVGPLAQSASGPHGLWPNRPLAQVSSGPISRWPIWPQAQFRPPAQVASGRIGLWHRWPLAQTPSGPSGLRPNQPLA